MKSSDQWRLRAKRWLFRWYVPLAMVLFAVLAGIAIGTTEGERRWQLLVALVGGTAAFVFTIQKQRLEELRLFNELFAKFNERFDGMNERLNALGSDQPIKDHKDLLYDYFNLCGEEYLMYVEGYIFPEVWEAWRRGMQHYRKHPDIRKLWDRELEQGSYYGLTPAELNRGGTMASTQATED